VTEGTVRSSRDSRVSLAEWRVGERFMYRFGWRITRRQHAVAMNPTPEGQIRADPIAWLGFKSASRVIHVGGNGLEAGEQTRVNHVS